MEYEVILKYKKNDFINLSKILHYQKKSLRIFKMADRILSILSGGFLIIFSIFIFIFFIDTQLTTNNTIKPPLEVPIIMIAMEIIYILISIYNYGLSGKLMWKKYNKKGSEIKFCFYEGEFSQLESLVEHKYNYSIVNKIYEDKSAYYLLIDKANGFIINKYGITNPQQFATFISEKTGLKIVKIK